MQSNRTLLKYYRTINAKFFENQLPHNVCVRYSNEREQAKYETKYFAWTSDIEGTDQDDGYHKYVIVISKAKNPGRTALLATLAHEMCHIATGMKDDHGPAFEAQRQMISDRGIFKKGALLEGLTIF